MFEIEKAGKRPKSVTDRGTICCETHFASAMRAILHAYSQAYLRHPYRAAFFTALVKGSIADGVAQLQVEQRGSLDIRRNVLFSTWSAAYCGSAQHFIFNRLFSRAFGEGTGVAVALTKASADSFIATPLLGIPIYYACKPLIEQGEFRPIDGLKEYAEIFCDFYFKPAMVWIPAHLLTFSVIPQQLRILWTASVSLGWLSFVSYTANSHGARGARAEETVSPQSQQS